MKRYRDYTDEELLALTSEQTGQLVDLECMVEGVALLPEAPNKPTEVDIQPDLVVFSICGVHFRDKSDAQKVADLLNTLPQLDTYYLNGGYSYSGPQGVKPATEPHSRQSVLEQRYWSDAHYDKHRSALAAHKEATTRYEKARKDYNEIAGQRADIANRVNKAISTAFEKKDNREEVECTFARYLGLSGDDRQQALSFYLLGQKRHTEDFVREVLGMPKEEQNGDAEKVH